MCEANAYLIEENDEKLVMEAVDTIEPEGDGLVLNNIFGEQKLLKARIHSLSLVEQNVDELTSSSRRTDLGRICSISDHKS
ncbi:MAG: CooT family nickel-binding protein [Deltaproteobacteria bacterium]|nr:CooT family nickel-binding protein [Deltaproteobacteria bacterium]